MFGNRLVLGGGAGLILLAITVLPRLVLYSYLTKQIRPTPYQTTTPYYAPPVYEYEQQRRYWGEGDHSVRSR